MGEETVGLRAKVKGSFGTYQQWLDAFKSMPKVLLVAARNFGLDGCFNHTAAISYYALLSIAPFLTLLAAILGFLLGSSEEGLEAALERLGNLVPELRPQLIAGARQVIENSGTIGLASLGLAVWFTSFVFGATQTAVNQIFKQVPNYHSWRRLALRTVWQTVKPFLLFLAAATLLVLSFIVQNTLAVLRARAPDLARGAMDFFGSLPTVPHLVSFFVTLAVFAIILQVLTARILPLPTLVPAAFVGALGWEAAKYLFGLYMGYASEALTFTGSAAAAVIFMLWIYFAGVGLLLTVEVAALLAGARPIGPPDAR